MGGVMELAAKYAYTVYQIGSFSAAASSLCISQPALSSMVAKLEGKLGFKLFDRSKSPIEPTARGKIYMEMLDEIIESEANMAKRINALTPKKSDQISVGSTTFLTSLFFPAACKDFVKKHPDVHVRLNAGAKISSRILTNQLKNKSLDFIIAYNTDEANQRRPLFNVRNIVAARRDLEGIEALMPYAITRSEALRDADIMTVPEEQLALFDKVKFITTDSITPYRNRLSALLRGHYSVSSISVRNISNYGMNYDMMSAGLGATVAKNIDLCAPLFDDDELVYFAFDEPRAHRCLQVFWRAGEDLSQAALDFIDMVSEKISLLIEGAK